MKDENILLDELPGGSKDAGRKTHNRDERRRNKRIRIHRDEEQQRARHCALGLNAYTHRDRDTAFFV
jgi:hypothetical protein